MELKAPSDWSITRLSRVAEVLLSSVNKKSLPDEIPVKLCNYMDVYSNPEITADLDFMEATATAAQVEKFGLRQGDVIITKDSEDPSDIAVPSIVAGPSDGLLVCGYHLAILRPQKVDGRYLAWALRSRPVNNQFARRANGTTRFGLTKAVIDSAAIPLPPVAEQRKIADILTNVDDAIAATRRVIEQRKRVKRGLVQTLLTRGIGHTRFKKTEIGEIPEAWEVVPLESLLAGSRDAMRSGPFGSALLKSELVAEGIPLLGIDNIHEEEFRPSYSRFVSPEKYQELQRYAVRPRDVVITIMGTVGRTCVLPPDIGPALSSKHLWTMTFDTERYMPELVSLQLNWAPWVQRHFMSQSQGGIMKAIRSDVLKSTPLPLPPLQEQTQIAAILDSCTTVEKTAEAEADSLDKVKRGLMQDLLTGRVRVKPN